MCKANNKKKAFTLTELLVVVIVIGVLSAAVLPKFSKVIETRKTTEAEELMASIRTEQEKRCALDKPYIADDISRLNDIVTNPDTKNYKITLQGTGVIASSKGNYSYTLEMPSYLDGRICCRGNDCEKLNKNYPNCDEGFTYEPSPESCAGTVTPVEPEIKTCSGSDTQACGCQSKGTQSRTCNTTTGEWSDWGACSISDACECTGTKPDASQDCNKCGTQTRTVTCDSTTGEWKTGSWGTCSKTVAQCTNCPEGKVYDEASDKCVCATSAADWDCVGTWECDDGSFVEPFWNEETCTCEGSCPEPTDEPRYLLCSRVNWMEAMGKVNTHKTRQEAKQACEEYGQDVQFCESFPPSMDCPDPNRPCKETPGWGRCFYCGYEPCHGVLGIGSCSTCDCYCGVG